MDLVVGTYDEVILGFKTVEVGQVIQLEASFTDHSHAGCVKCVTLSRKGVLASGSTDETIRLLDIKKHKELGSLVHHNGTVTSIQFHRGFLFSTSEDKTLCLWKAFTWECLRTFKGHKGAIDSVSVHPSGKLALTVGRDRALHTWNLITGRSAYITNLKQVADLVKWSPDGDKYAIVFRNTVNIYSVETAEVTVTLKADVPVFGLDFVNNDVCCYGGEGGSVVFHDVTNDRQLHICDTRSNRIKGLCITTYKFSGDTKSKVLCTASSEGEIKIFKISENQSEIDTELIAEHHTGFRITCLAVLSEYTENKSNMKKKQTGTEELGTKQKSTGPRKNVQKEKSKQITNKDQSVEETIDEDEEGSSSSESDLINLKEENNDISVIVDKTSGNSKVTEKPSNRTLKKEARKRKLNETDDSKSEEIKKTMKDGEKKPENERKKQDNTKYADTVSFVQNKVNKKKFKKRKKKQKKLG